MRRCYGFWTDRDSSTFPELAHPDVIIDLSRDIFIPGVHRGLERAAQ